MLVITSDGDILKSSSSLTGRSLIAFFAEPDDKISEFSDMIRSTISVRIVPPTSIEQILSALDSLRKHLLHSINANEETSMFDLTSFNPPQGCFCRQCGLDCSLRRYTCLKGRGSAKLLTSPEKTAANIEALVSSLIENLSIAIAVRLKTLQVFPQNTGADMTDYTKQNGLLRDRGVAEENR